MSHDAIKEMFAEMFEESVEEPGIPRNYFCVDPKIYSLADWLSMKTEPEERSFFAWKVTRNNEGTHYAEEIEGRVGDWVVVRTNKGNIDGVVHKINYKTIVVRLQCAGKYKYIKRYYGHEMIEKNDIVACYNI